MTNLSSLIERIEKSEGADRELDGAIALSLGWTLQKMKGDARPYYRKPGVTQYYNRAEPPAYTASIDAVRSLIEPGDEWELTTLYGVARATVGLNRDHRTSWPGYGEHKGGDPVRALLSAALKARNLP